MQPRRGRERRAVRSRRVRRRRLWVRGPPSGDCGDGSASRPCSCSDSSATPTWRDVWVRGITCISRAWRSTPPSSTSRTMLSVDNLRNATTVTLNYSRRSVDNRRRRTNPRDCSRSRKKSRRLFSVPIRSASRSTTLLFCIQRQHNVWFGSRHSHRLILQPSWCAASKIFTLGFRQANELWVPDAAGVRAIRNSRILQRCCTPGSTANLNCRASHCDVAKSPIQAACRLPGVVQQRRWQSRESRPEEGSNRALQFLSCQVFDIGYTWWNRGQSIQVGRMPSCKSLRVLCKLHECPGSLCLLPSVTVLDSLTGILMRLVVRRGECRLIFWVEESHRRSSSSGQLPSSRTASWVMCDAQAPPAKAAWSSRS